MLKTQDDDLELCLQLSVVITVKSWVLPLQAKALLTVKEIKKAHHVRNYYLAMAPYTPQTNLGKSTLD